MLCLRRWSARTPDVIASSGHSAKQRHHGCNDECAEDEPAIRNRGPAWHDLYRLQNLAVPPSGDLAGSVPVEPASFDHVVFLGTGWTYAIAQEAVLKCRETRSMD